MSYQWDEIAAKLTKYLRLHTTPIGIKAFDSIEEMEKVPKLRRAKHIHVPCQFLGQAIQLGTTVGYTAEDIATENCSCTVGILKQNEEFRSGKIFSGGWCATDEDAAGHHGILTEIDPPYAGIAVSPITSGRIEPDVVLLTLYPGQAFMLLAGYLRNDFKPLNFPHIGESSCSMHWVRTLKTGEIGLALPCFAEMRFAGFSAKEVNISITPKDLVKALEGVEELSAKGFRYPVPDYAVQMDVCEGVGVSYKTK